MGSRLDQGQPHQHSYSQSVTNTTTGDFIDADGKRHCYKIEYWEDKCICGNVKSTGNTTSGIPC